MSNIAIAILDRTKLFWILDVPILIMPTIIQPKGAEHHERRGRENLTYCGHILLISLISHLTNKNR